MNDFKLTGIPSEMDVRDWHISRVVNMPSSIPISFMLNYDFNVYHQGSVGSCVAHSLAYVSEFHEYVENGVKKRFSPGYLYALRREDDHQKTGLIPRQALKNLSEFGNVEYRDFPVNEEYPDILKKFTPLKRELKAKAKKYRVKHYVKLHSEQEIKAALMKLGPVTMIMNLTTDFYSMKNGKYIGSPNAPHRGYHQMTIVGWDEEGFIVLNSWGRNWQNEGFFTLPYGEMKMIKEFWSIADRSNIERKTSLFKTIINYIKGWLHGREKF